ncbi:hypothetical protein [Paenibacillus xylaniclasticus]|uniref:hypothetical protein n=1 Tax=Paenibacillus xylaniclasticus TaxID=588083 RepID=UPI000FDCAC19|nr:hypothetical protein [Paenibacillus xylaniclasticus]
MYPNYYGYGYPYYSYGYDNSYDPGYDSNAYAPDVQVPHAEGDNSNGYYYDPRGMMPPGQPPGPPGPPPRPPGPFPPGPFPPGPFPPGPFPPGPFPPGPFPPGPFPPPRPPFPPGPFPPPRPPFPPGPFPIPLPIPVPFPPGPSPIPNAVTVLINGGRVFPNATQAYTVPFFQGITIAQALRATGAVTISFNGQITSVRGIPITDGITYTLRINGRPIPSTLLNTPLQRGDNLELELHLRPLRSEDEVIYDGTYEVQNEEEHNNVDEDDFENSD